MFRAILFYVMMFTTLIMIGLGLAQYTSQASWASALKDVVGFLSLFMPVVFPLAVVESYHILREKKAKAGE